MDDETMNDVEVATHPEPAWRERADFLVGHPLGDDAAPLVSEQLWARQLGEKEFEVCCIPFFPYDLALGDIVETAAGRNHAVVRVLRRSGRSTFRVWFGASSVEAGREQVVEHIRGAHLFEWYSRDLLAIDSDREHAQSLADYLMACEASGLLVYETGETGSGMRRPEDPVKVHGVRRAPAR